METLKQASHWFQSRALRAEYIFFVCAVCILFTGRAPCRVHMFPHVPSVWPGRTGRGNGKRSGRLRELERKCVCLCLSFLKRLPNVEAFKPHQVPLCRCNVKLGWGGGGLCRFQAPLCGKLCFHPEWAVLWDSQGLWACFTACFPC